MDELVFIGDIHGNLRALNELWARVNERARHSVFLGDYINKGDDSYGVIQMLISLNRAGQATLVVGNHELALLDALDRRDLSGFLKMGGAKTIRSYAGGNVGANVAQDFIGAIPTNHVDAIRAMPSQYENHELIAQHEPPTSQTRKFVISGHRPVGSSPQIGPSDARLDTGCGTHSGRLTAFFWPSRTYVQVNNDGTAAS